MENHWADLWVKRISNLLLILGLLLMILGFTSWAMVGWLLSKGVL